MSLSFPYFSPPFSFPQAYVCCFHFTVSVFTFFCTFLPHYVNEGDVLSDCVIGLAFYLLVDYRAVQIVFQKMIPQTQSGKMGLPIPNLRDRWLVNLTD